MVKRPRLIVAVDSAGAIPHLCLHPAEIEPCGREVRGNPYGLAELLRGQRRVGIAALAEDRRRQSHDDQRCHDHTADRFTLLSPFLGRCDGRFR